MMRAVLTAEQRQEIARLRKEGVSGVLVAEKFGVTRACVCKIYRAAIGRAPQRSVPQQSVSVTDPIPPLAPQLGIRKVTRRVPDNRATSSQGHGEDYGYVHVSLPHISFIDGPCEQRVEA